MLSGEGGIIFASLHFAHPAAGNSDFNVLKII